MIAGIHALKREGPNLVLACGVLVAFVGILTLVQGWEEFLEFGIPTLASIGPSMIIAAIFRSRFA